MSKSATHDDLIPANWKLMCTDITEDDHGCARFQVNSMIRAADDVATSRAACLLEAAPDLLAACEAASGFVEAHALALGDAGKVGASQAALVAYDQLRSAIAAARGGKGGEK